MIESGTQRLGFGVQGRARASGVDDLREGTCPSGHTDNHRHTDQHPYGIACASESVPAIGHLRPSSDQSGPRRIAVAHESRHDERDRYSKHCAKQSVAEIG